MIILKTVNIIFVSGKDVELMLDDNERNNLISWLNDSENSNNVYVIKQKTLILRHIKHIQFIKVK